MTVLTVMGAGSWGSTFASIAADAGSEVRLWARRAEVADAITTTHRNPGYLGEGELNPAILATTDAEQALHGADIVVLAVPSLALRDSLVRWRPLMTPGTTTVSLVKGIDLATQQRASQVIEEVWDPGPGRVVVLSGPNLARECLARQPAATVVAGSDPDVTAAVQAACHTPWVRVYTNTDLIGVEVAGAVKNPLAIAAGMAGGLGHGDNTKAALLTRGLAEMTRLGVALGGDPLTFSGLAGVGDLMATCASPQSRNHRVGRMLGEGESLADILASTSMVAEGVRSARPLLSIAEGLEVEMPILQQVVRVVHEGADPAEVGLALMGRSPKAEFHGFGSAAG